MDKYCGCCRSLERLSLLERSGSEHTDKLLPRPRTAAAHFLAPLWGPGRGSKMGPFLAPKHEAREWVQRLRHRWKFVRGRMPVQTIVPLDTMCEKAGLFWNTTNPKIRIHGAKSAGLFWGPKSGPQNRGHIEVLHRRRGTNSGPSFGSVFDVKMRSRSGNGFNSWLRKCHKIGN